MANSTDDVIRFVRDADNDVKFVRLAFCDVNGTPKNISIPPDGLADAFARGVSFDPGAIDGFDDFGFAGETAPSPRLFPDPGTLAILPWRPSHGRVARFYCDIKDKRGEHVFDTRNTLRDAVTAAEARGLSIRATAESDFYLFRDEGDGDTPFDRGGYFDVFPLDRGENVRRDICSYLNTMSIAVTASYHSRGAGQNTIKLKSTDVLACADNHQTLKAVVAAVSGQHGLVSSFSRRVGGELAESLLRVTFSVAKKGVTNRAGVDLDPSGNPYTALLNVVKTL